MPHLNTQQDFTFFGWSRNECMEMDMPELCAANMAMGDDYYDRFGYGDVYSDSSYNVTQLGAATHNPCSTASGKSFLLDVEENVGPQCGWSNKDVRQWTSQDIMGWIIAVADRHNYDYVRIHMQSFNVDGLMLGSMTETEFIARAPEFGSTLYHSLQEFMASQLPPFCSFDKSACNLPMMGEPHMLTDLNTRTNEFRHIEISDAESTPSPVQLPPPRRAPGRPRGTRTKKKPEKRTGRLWEFIRDLLLNREYCPSLICWDDHDNGVFRFVHSEKVAKLWGTIKENPKMTYEKLSRAMRYYYKSKVLQPVLGRRLVYKFGPTATGWRTPNPNFLKPE